MHQKKKVGFGLFVFILLAATISALVLWFFYPWVFVFPDTLRESQTCEIVVSAYRENLDWLQTLPLEYKQTVYCKHEDTFKEGRIMLPNVGRCDMTFVYHIVKRYNDLPDITIFATGSTSVIPRKHYTLFSIILPRLGSKINFKCLGETGPVDTNFSLNSYQATCKANQHDDQTLIPASIRPFNKWFETRFPGLPLSHLAVYNGTFAVPKSSILMVPKSTWIMLLEELSVGDNLEVSHFMERSWYSLFTQ
jgi:hypothetical protein